MYLVHNADQDAEISEDEEEQEDWTAFAASQVRRTIDTSSDNYLFPSTTMDFNSCFGRNSDLVFVSFLQTYEDEDEEDEDEEDDEDYDDNDMDSEEEDDEDEGTKKETRAPTSSKDLLQLRKSRKAETSDDIVNRLASGDSDDADIDKLIAAIEREVDSTDSDDSEEEDDTDGGDEESEYEESEDADEDEIEEDDSEEEEEEVEEEVAPPKVQRKLNREPGVAVTRKGIHNRRQR
jgi:hypothetical protein